MKLRIIGVFLSLLVLTVIPANAQKKTAGDELTGDWYGESKCTGNNPYCHDEVVIYHLTHSKADPAKIHLAADKVVNGKPEEMGEFELVYDVAKQTLTTEFRIPRTGGKGVWFFKINGDKIDGTLTVFPENEIGRRVKVTRKKPDSKP
jgi:hypothetical protein